jgi:HlyD family secretion protein
MLKTITIVSAVCILAMTSWLSMIEQPIGAQEATRTTADQPGWQAVAQGLIEPRSGKIAIASSVIGRVAGVLVNTNERVLPGELLVRLDDQEASARVATAEARVAMQKRLRNDQGAGKAAERRKAEDAVADAESVLVAARDAFDKATSARGSVGGSTGEFANERSAWTTAQDGLNQKRMELRRIEAESGTPLPTESEGQLNVARLDLWTAQVELEKTRIRSPIAGAVLQVKAKVGELAAPSSLQPLLVLGDISALQVRAELDERDISKISVGQPVVIRADAFRGYEFAGRVSAIAPIVQPRTISSFGRNVTNLDATEVLIDLSDPGPLVVGMKVNAYFQAVSVAN